MDSGVDEQLVSGLCRLPAEMVQHAILISMRSGQYEDVIRACESDARVRALCGDNTTDWLAAYPEARGLFGVCECDTCRPSLLDVAARLVEEKARQTAKRCALYALYALGVQTGAVEGPLLALDRLSLSDLEGRIWSCLCMPDDDRAHKASIPVSETLPAEDVPGDVRPIPIGIKCDWLNGVYTDNMPRWYRNLHFTISGYGFRPLAFHPTDLGLVSRKGKPDFDKDRSSLTDKRLRRAINARLSQAAVRAVVDTGTKGATPMACASVDLFEAYPGTTVHVLAPWDALDGDDHEPMDLAIVPAIPGLGSSSFVYDYYDREIHRECGEISGDDDNDDDENKRKRRGPYEWWSDSDTNTDSEGDADDDAMNL